MSNFINSKKKEKEEKKARNHFEIFYSAVIDIDCDICAAI
jgi:hypothetical protein